MKKKKKDMFNPAFIELKKRVKTFNKAPVNSITEKDKKPVDELRDDRFLFENAMSDVTPIDKTDRSRVPGPGKNLRPAHLSSKENEEAVAYLHDLVAGSIDMDITFSDEYIEGSISGVRRNIMKRLKRGEFPIQDHIDLHGLTRKDAAAMVRNFLIKSHGRGLRCVLIVHGRGLNSPDSIPVLKERLPVWLNRGPARKMVMAFATARPYDGGTGAIYVLLRGHRANPPSSRSRLQSFSGTRSAGHKE